MNIKSVEQLVNCSYAIRNVANKYCPAKENRKEGEKWMTVREKVRASRYLTWGAIFTYLFLFLLHETRWMPLEFMRVVCGSVAAVSAVVMMIGVVNWCEGEGSYWRKFKQLLSELFPRESDLACIILVSTKGDRSVEENWKELATSRLRKLAREVVAQEKHYPTAREILKTRKKFGRLIKLFNHFKLTLDGLKWDPYWPKPEEG